MSGLVSSGVTALFFWVLMHARFCLCSFPQSCGSPIIKSHRPSKSDSLRIPSLFSGYPAWEPWYGAQNLHNSGKTLVLLFSSLCIAHPVYQDLILSCLCPSYILIAVYSSSSNMEYFFFFLVSSSILLLMVVQHLVEILELLQGGECMLFYSTILKWDLICGNIFMASTPGIIEIRITVNK